MRTVIDIMIENTATEKTQPVPLMLDLERVAQILSISKRQLYKWSRQSNPPCFPCIMIGRSVRYLVREVEEWTRQVALRGAVDDRELARITTDLIKQRPGPYNGGQNEHTALSSLCQRAPKAPVSHKGKGQRTLERFRKYVEASVGEHGS